MDRPPVTADAWVKASARFAALVAVLLTLSLVSAPAAHAQTVAAAQRAARAAKAQARAAAAQVDALLDRYTTASAQVASGVGQLSDAFADSASADVTSAEAARQRRRAQALQREQVRDVYALGGTAGLVASVLGANSPDDALWRASTATRVMSSVLADTAGQVGERDAVAAVAERRAATADAATNQQAAALDELQVRQHAAATALAQAQATLASLSTQARRATVAVAAARRIAAAAAAAAAASAAAASSVTAIGIPAQYVADYQAAARTCSGMSWTLLAAVGQIESGHGANVGPSSAGAIGPMQFMPATFAAYAVDGDGNGVKDAWDPEDAIWTAARYLCVLGAQGGSADGIQHALFGYNHAQWYVDLVLSAERSITAAQTG